MYRSYSFIVGYKINVLYLNQKEFRFNYYIYLVILSMLLCYNCALFFVSLVRNNNNDHYKMVK